MTRLACTLSGGTVHFGTAGPAALTYKKRDTNMRKLLSLPIMLLALSLLAACTPESGQNGGQTNAAACRTGRDKVTQAFTVRSQNAEEAHKRNVRSLALLGEADAVAQAESMHSDSMRVLAREWNERATEAARVCVALTGNVEVSLRRGAYEVHTHTDGDTIVLGMLARQADALSYARELSKAYQ